jgi:hypothetical protein
MPATHCCLGSQLALGPLRRAQSCRREEARPFGCWQSGDCEGNGGGGMGNSFLNGAGGGAGNDFPGNPTPGCSPVFDSDGNQTGLNCDSSGGSQGAGQSVGRGNSTASISSKGGFYNGNRTITDINGRNCTPSVFDPSCQKPSCPAVFFKGVEEADIGLPYNADEAARTAAAAATRHIVNRGLVVPLRSSIVRNFVAAGEFAGSALVLGPILYQEVVGFVHELRAWNAGQCMTIWSKP